MQDTKKNNRKGRGSKKKDSKGKAVQGKSENTAKLGHRCVECTHKARHFPKGVCPACGSANVIRLDGGLEKEPKVRGSINLVFCLSLWLMLGVEIYRKLVE